MMLTMLATIFLNGFAILLAILCLMRLLYRLGICEAPRLAIDSVEDSEVDEAPSSSSLPNFEAPDMRQSTPVTWRPPGSQRIQPPASGQAAGHAPADAWGVLG